MNIIYQEIDSSIEDTIVTQYGSWVRDYKCPVKGETKGAGQSASRFTNRSQSAAQRDRHDLCHAGFAGDFIYFLMGFRLMPQPLFCKYPIHQHLRHEAAEDSADHAEQHIRGKVDSQIQSGKPYQSRQYQRWNAETLRKRPIENPCRREGAARVSGRKGIVPRPADQGHQPLYGLIGPDSGNQILQCHIIDQQRHQQRQ